METDVLTGRKTDNSGNSFQLSHTSDDNISFQILHLEETEESIHPKGRLYGWGGELIPSF